MGKTEIDAVRDWLGREGYPLEYETAREMARVGYRPWQGRYYKDPDTGDPREIDVQATEPDSITSPWRPVRVVAECKQNSKPWLVLTEVVELPAGYGGNFLLTKDVPKELLVSSKDRDASFVLTPPERHGYMVVQAISGPDTPFAALQAVTKAAQDSIAELSGGQSAICIPVIVVGGSLYQLGFEDDGREILEPVLWQRVVWHGTRPVHRERSQAVQVDVVTRAHLPAYLRSLRAATKALARLLGTIPARS